MSSPELKRFGAWAASRRVLEVLVKEVVGRVCIAFCGFVGVLWHVLGVLGSLQIEIGFISASLKITSLYPVLSGRSIIICSPSIIEASWLQGA
jgi:hypothetical protein